MKNGADSNKWLSAVTLAIKSLISATKRGVEHLEPESIRDEDHNAFLEQSGKLIILLEQIRLNWTQRENEQVEISLGRPDNLAKFFAFSFINQARRKLDQLTHSKFQGSGVYAIYYVGNSESSYAPLSSTESPIYVGKATPQHPFAQDAAQQGFTLFKRLGEHARNINRTNLGLSDFEYRAVTVQSGMEAAVEDFLIRLFKPIWNKEVKICFGIGKHGDSASTRRNKRSPWDTLHPGRNWAKATESDQCKIEDIRKQITRHLKKNPPIKNRDQLLDLISLVSPIELEAPSK